MLKNVLMKKKPAIDSIIAKQKNQKYRGVINLNSFSNFNILFIWKEVELTIIKIISYLKDNKIGEEIKSIMSNPIYNSRDSSDFLKLESVLIVLDTTLKENPSEELNVFFVEFYRLSALYLYCTDDKPKAYEILNRFIDKINENFSDKDEFDIDINLLVERDKLLINKAQMLFWDEQYNESLKIIYSKIAYYEKDTTDDIYCLKMINLMISAVNYKAWINGIQQEHEESEKSFALALNLIEDSKKLLRNNFTNADLKEVFKRKVKTLSQYLNYLILRIGDDLSMQNIEISCFVETGHKNALEIIKVLNKDSFEFDEEIHKSHLIYYYLEAALLSLGVSCDDPNFVEKLSDGKNIQINNFVDLEHTTFLLVCAYVQNILQELQCKIKYREMLSFFVFKFLDIITKFGKIIQKYLPANRNTFDNKLVEDLEKIEINMRYFIEIFDEKGNYTENEKIQNFFFDLPQIPNRNYNFALVNINRFSTESMNKTITTEINEIFVIEYLSNKILYVLAKIMKDSVEVFKNFKENTHVMESLNGYLVIEKDSLTLVITNSIFSEFKQANSEFFGNSYDKYAQNKIINEIKLEKSDKFVHFFTKHHFEIKKDYHTDIYTFFLYLNSFYLLELYKPCLAALNFILTEFEKLKGYFSGNNENIKTQGYLDLYLFFIFFAVKIYMKINDYFMATKLLFEISEYDYDYAKFLHNILIGVCLTKIKYSDLGSIFLDQGCQYLQKAFEYDDCVLIDNDNKSRKTKLNKLDKKIISEDLIKPTRMFLCSVNLMKIKAIEKFQEELILNQNICFYCEVISTKKKNEIIQVQQDLKKNFSCLKCYRANYCSIECMKKNKIRHDPVCLNYAEKFSEINELIDNFIK